MAGSGINGIALGTIGVGGLFMYAAITNKSIIKTVQAIVLGKSPKTVTSNPTDIYTSSTGSGDAASDSGPIGGAAGVGAAGAAGTTDVTGPDWATKQYPKNGPETLSLKQWGQVWILAGGSSATAPIAAAITIPEAGRRPGAVQAGQPYGTTGWGGWQITPGNSVPSAGIDDQLLTPIRNAHAAVAKWKAAGGFSPWVTYENGAFSQYVAQAKQALGL